MQNRGIIARLYCVVLQFISSGVPPRAQLDVPVGLEAKVNTHKLPFPIAVIDCGIVATSDTTIFHKTVGT